MNTLKEILVDAARYRFIKGKSRGELYDMGVDLGWYMPTEDLDESIDAAITAELAKEKA